MKKYLSLFVVLSMVFVINANITRAKNNASFNTLAKIETKTREDLKIKKEIKEISDNNDDDGEIPVSKDLKPFDHDNDGIADDKDPDDNNDGILDVNDQKPLPPRTNGRGTDKYSKMGRENIKKEIETRREQIKKEIKIAREEARHKMENLKEKVKEEKDAVKAKIKESRIAGREKALERFDIAISRIENLKNKISAQIVRLETKGIDTAKAKDFMTTAETKLNEAKVKITEANTLFSASINELTSENKTKLRTLTKEIQTLIRESHKALNNAVRSLKDSIKAILKDLKNAAKTKEADDAKDSNNGNSGSN